MMFRAMKNIEFEIRHNRKTSSPQSMHGCVCLICGEYRDELTKLHAESHGLTKKEMIMKGLVRYTNQVKEKSMEKKRGILTN